MTVGGEVLSKGASSIGESNFPLSRETLNPILLSEFLAKISALNVFISITDRAVYDIR